MYQFDSSLIPRLRSFEEVQQRFDKAFHVRTDYLHVRRLCDTGVKGKERTRGVRQKHKLLTHENRSEYHAVLYESSLVKFFPDHYELSLQNWDSRSTIDFIYALTGLNLIPYNSEKDIPEGYLYYVNGGKNNFLKESKGYLHYVPVANASRYITYLGKQCLIGPDRYYSFNYDNTPVNTTQFGTRFKYKVDRKQMNAVRKQASKFINYVNTTFALQSEDGGKTAVLPPLESNEARDNIETAYQDIFMLVSKRSKPNEDEWYDLYRALLYTNAPRSWADDPIRVSKCSVIKDLDKILKQTHVNTLKRIEV